MRWVRGVVRLASWGLARIVVLAILLRQFCRMWREYRRPEIISDDLCEPAVGVVYAIVVKYAGYGLDSGFVSLLTLLRAQNVNTVLVCNGMPEQPTRDALSSLVHRLLVRPNVGRDFGAYRAATLRLLDDGIRPQRLIYLNDSLLFLPGAPLKEFVQQLLDPDADVVGAFENFAISRHFGSFALSISRKVCEYPALREFWSSYKPFDERTRTINSGELKLSRVLLRGGFRASVIYSSQRLAESLNRLSLYELIDLMRYMPIIFRRSELMLALGVPALVAQQLTDTSAPRRAPVSASRFPIATAPAPTSSPMENDFGARASGIAAPGLRELGERAAASSLGLAGPSRPPPATVPARLQEFAAPDATRLVGALSRTAIVDRLMECVTQGSQIHWGFGLYHRLLDCPLVKRDLLWRGIYAEQDCSAVLDRLPEETRRGILRDLLGRGRPIGMGFVQRFLYGHGLI